MSQLLLHIGTHKTATTTIQRFLRRNDGPLAERGLWYPDLDLTGLSARPNHVSTFVALAGRDRTLGRADARRFLEAVRGRAGEHAATLLSAESLWRLVDASEGPKPPADPEAYWPARRRWIETVREAVGPARVVVVLRPRDRYAASHYQEHVKATRYRRGFAAFRRDFWWHFDYLSQLRAWAEAFPDPIVLGFDALVAGRDPAGAFLAALGMEAGDLPRPEPQNESLRPDLVALKRALNAGPGTRGELRTRVETLEAALPADETPRSLWASAEEADAFRTSYADDDAALAAEFAPGLDLSGRPADPDLAYGDAMSPAFLDALSRRALEKA